MKTETLESIGATGTKVSLIGAGTASAGLWTASELAAVIGALVAIAGLCITWHYKREAHRRLAAESDLRNRERLLRIDLMERAGHPIPHDTDLGALEADE